MPSWWGWQTANSRDRATSHLPALLYERLDEMGIDFSILYPSTTLGLIDIDDPELRRDDNERVVGLRQRGDAGFTRGVCRHFVQSHKAV